MSTILGNLIKGAGTIGKEVLHVGAGTIAAASNNLIGSNLSVKYDTNAGKAIGNILGTATGLAASLVKKVVPVVGVGSSVATALLAPKTSSPGVITTEATPKPSSGVVAGIVNVSNPIQAGVLGSMLTGAIVNTKGIAKPVMLAASAGLGASTVNRITDTPISAAASAALNGTGVKIDIPGITSGGNFWKENKMWLLPSLIVGGVLAFVGLLVALFKKRRR